MTDGMRPFLGAGRCARHSIPRALPLGWDIPGFQPSGSDTRQAATGQPRSFRTASLRSQGRLARQPPAIRDPS
ncbi:MAG: hypothetical protein LBL42_03760 [Tannerella sp.]|nr:hypothetical protein [Tannerella sp.]